MINFKRIPVLFICFFLAVLNSTAFAVNAPEAEKNKAVPVLAKASELVSVMTVNDLVQDDYFLKMLSEILNRKDFSEEDKVDAFYLMLKKIRWSFSGVVNIPSKYDYRAIFNGYVGVFLPYQEKLKSLNYNGDPLIEIAKRDYKTHVMHASNALLLAAVLDPESVIHSISFFMYFEHIQESQVPDIFIHYICLSTALTLKLEHVLELSAFLDKKISEEAKEDLLCSLSIFSSAQSGKRILAYLGKAPREGEDLTVETALLILKRIIPPDVFPKIREMLIKANPPLKDSFDKLEARDFSSSITQEQGTFMKIWEAMDVVLYDDGMFISYKDKFTDFIEK